MSAKKPIDPKEKEAVALLSSRHYKDDGGIFFTPYLAGVKIPDDEWKAMEYLTLYRGYNFKNKKG